MCAPRYIQISVTSYKMHLDLLTIWRRAETGVPPEPGRSFNPNLCIDEKTHQYCGGNNNPNIADAEIIHPPPRLKRTLLLKYSYSALNGEYVSNSAAIYFPHPHFENNLAEINKIIINKKKKAPRPKDTLA